MRDDRLSSPAPTAEPNVTPLIDVMLVLLILFMLVTPIVHHGLDTALPRSSDQTMPVPESPPVISVRADDLELDGRRLASSSALEDHLRDLFGGRAGRTVFVRAAEDVTYGRMVAAIDAARGAGAERIGLMGTHARRSPSSALAPARDD
jgi:biopolymer transport protein ExbD